jgi:tetrahydromethanopterin S-methyltransferase subunit G
MALTEGDRIFLQTEFNRLHDRINKTDSAVHQVKDEITVQIGKHVEDKHNPARTWGIVASIIAVCTGVMEVIKWLVKKGP